MRRSLRIAAALVLLACEPAARADFSAEYQANLRKTIAMRTQRQRSLASRPGRIVPFPMPPTLIIRQTPEVHGEIRDLLRLLRGG